MALEEIGRYRLSDKLGEGAMGVVYRGFDPLLERTVAIKTIKLDLSPAEQDEFERRFFREAKSSARLNHPNIVTVYDAGESGDMAYIAMEFLEGRDLRQLMGKGRTVPPDLAVDIIAGVADGLAYAHQNGVVHRDVKPANIMVLDNGGVKLADFGIAQLQTGAKTQTGALLGTPKYMAPEQIVGEPVDGRADIFSLGVVLYQLLTGAPPFDGDTMTAIMYRVINEPALSPSQLAGNIPSGFEYILSKALAKKPENRYQTAGEFAADLRRYRKLAHTPPLPWTTGGIAGAEPGAEGQPTAKERRRRGAEPRSTEAASGVNRRWLAGAALAIILAIGGMAFLSDGEAPAPEPTTLATASAEVAPVPPPPAQPAPAQPPEPPPTPTPAPAPPPVKPATLALAITPWGEVVVDGESKGVSPPLARLRLPPGKHRIEIKNAGAAPYTTEIDLKAGETRRLKHKF